ncbi:hypothetical protein U9M48_042179 [Paspalum notatum var. saurae]|uniref:Serine/threonine-protein phosphatase 4 regulatory subunit 3-like central domain-containing protein n=1 Tax=Paspalum notatum var. saurae TaxID=547442 RepID=A0AAQ3XFX8_PASNO
MSRFAGKPGVLAMMQEAEAEEARRRSAEVRLPNTRAIIRVRLADDGQWENQGAGHVTVDYTEGSRESALAVVNEKDNGTLPLRKITLDDIYKKEDKTISWKDAERALELGLKFEEAEGCTYIWKKILAVQENLQAGSLAQVIPCPTFGTREDELMDLPPLELSSLPLLLKNVLEWGAKDKLRVAELISQDDIRILDCRAIVFGSGQHGFFPKLVELFKMSENSRKMDDLYMIFRLVRGIISLNNLKIFYKIFSDEFILDIIGALEYDPEATNVERHRDVVQKHGTSKMAVPIGNPYVASMIHQTYVIGYIKDVILRKTLDGDTMQGLKTIIHVNNFHVASFLKDDASFIKDLLAKMRSSNISSESKSKLVLFFHNFCILSKSLNPAQQLQLSRDLVDEGVFDIISDMLQSQDKVLVSAGSDILMHFLDQDPNIVREFIAYHEENYLDGNSLLGILVQGMLTDSGEGKHYQSCLRTLLGSSGPDEAAIYEDVVIQVFFDKHLPKLIDVIASCCTPKGIAGPTSSSAGVDKRAEQHSAEPETLLNICEILSFCVIHHPYRIKLNFFASNSMEKILTLTSRREKVLNVAAVQFMRTIVGRKDEFLISHIIKLNLLKPIIEVFVENGNRDNMLCSVVLELLEYIRKENLDSLIEYIAEFFGDQLVKFEQLGSIQAFRSKHQEIVESAKTRQSASMVDTRKEADERGADKEEEDYSNKDSDGEDSATPAKHAQKQSIPARHKSDGLADCDDDYDYYPPLRNPVKADEAVTPKVRSRLDDVIRTYGEAGKKPNIRFNLSFAKSVASANVKGRHAHLEDTEVPLSSPSTSTESPEGSGDPQNQQHAPETLDPERQKDEDCNAAAGDLSPKMIRDTTKATNSEPK